VVPPDAWPRWAAGPYCRCSRADGVPPWCRVREQDPANARDEVWQEGRGTPDLEEGAAEGRIVTRASVKPRLVAQITAAQWPLLLLVRARGGWGSNPRLADKRKPVGPESSLAEGLFTASRLVGGVQWDRVGRARTGWDGMERVFSQGSHPNARSRLVDLC
jgi:hypothetical protein